MKIYWIIVNGQPRGPFTPEEIAELGVVSPSLKVWHKGLPEWVTITEVPELASLLPEDAATVDPVVSEAEEVTAVEVEAEASAEAEPQPQPQQTYASASWGAAPSPTPSQQSSVSAAEPMPQTYLPWNVLATVCCCLPAGIIGIIFSARVSKKYNEGDIEGARRASEGAAWCLMISIVLGLVCWPFQMLFV